MEKYVFSYFLLKNIIYLILFILFKIKRTGFEAKKDKYWVIFCKNHG